MHYTITFLNGDSQLPADESGMTSISLLAFLTMSAYGAWYFGRAVARMRQQGQVHLLTLLFGVAYGLQTASAFCEWAHLRTFAADGKGLRWRHTWLALDFGAALLQSTSELLLSVMLIALAFGWTLGLESQEPLDGLAGKLLAGLHSPGKLLTSSAAHTHSAALLVGLGGLQFLLLALGRRYEEDFNHFHDFEHLPGLALLSLRLGLCAVFCWATARSSARETQREVVAFVRQLRWFGATWFVGLPALVLLARVLPPYRRHQLVAGGATFVQAASLALLSALFAEGSHYYKMSSLRFVGASSGGGFSMGSTFAPKGLRAKIAVD